MHSLVEDDDKDNGDAESQWAINSACDDGTDAGYEAWEHEAEESKQQDTLNAMWKDSDDEEEAARE